MFDIRITVGEIDYEKTMKALFPGILAKCRELESRNTLIRLFLELGEDAVEILLGIMGRLSDAAKQELLCQCMNGYRPVLTDRINEYLQTDSLGRNFVIRDIYMERTAGGLELLGEGVRVDYNGLLENEGVQSRLDAAAASVKGLGGLGKIFVQHTVKALKTAAKAVPEETERLGLKLLQKEEIRRKLCDLAQGGLQKRGLILELKGLSFVQGCDSEEEGIVEIYSHSLRLTPELETELIKALAGYLHSSCKAVVNDTHK